jgi:hypothetical protein
MQFCLQLFKNYGKNNENPLIVNLVKYSMKSELSLLDSIFLTKN